MPVTERSQLSFSKGEVGPDFYGRSDLVAYQTGLKKARNMFVRQTGGIEKRPGTEFVAPCKYADRNTRLIPFIFNADDRYVLEFGHEYIRVFRDDVLLTHPALTISSITRADPCVVTINGHEYENGDWVFITGTNVADLNGRFFVVRNKTANTFNIEDIYSGANVAASSAGTKGSGLKVFEIATEYQEHHLDGLKFSQINDIIVLTHSSFPAKELVRTGHTEWTLGNLAFASVKPEEETTNELNYLSAPQNVRSNLRTAGSGTSYVHKFFVTSYNSLQGVESPPQYRTPGWPFRFIDNSSQTRYGPLISSLSGNIPIYSGDIVYIEMGEGYTDYPLHNRYFLVYATGRSSIHLQNEDGKGRDKIDNNTDVGTIYTCSHVLNAKGNASYEISWDAVDNVNSYRIYKTRNNTQTSSSSENFKNFDRIFEVNNATSKIFTPNSV